MGSLSIRGGQGRTDDEVRDQALVITRAFIWLVLIPGGGAAFWALCYWLLGLLLGWGE